MSSEQFEHIQRIRSDFYASERLKASTNSSIQALATDLYKEDTHFIFELIQNAEDNTYKKNGAYLPYISFELTKNDPTGTPYSDGALIIRNNEIGFSPDNVDAICAVGRTTKKKEQGYIGEKGIGFKSVFRVTENPHIFSNGYYFCLPEFDVETGLGYIVPQWVNTLPEELDLSITYIILPLTKQDFGYKEIEEMLRDIEPEIILFLSTLQEIQIKTDTGDDFTILKDDSAIPEIQILAEGKKEGLNFSNSDAFLVCPGCFDKPADIHHEKRKGIRDREVTIGFPLNEHSTAVGKLFAYLPVRSGTGFPFLINADFILPSSREDIQDVPWNRWLMDCVADLIATGLLPLLKERKFLSVDFLEALASQLNSLAADKNNLFYPIFGRLRETFMNEELLPANDKTFISAQSAKLADSERLIKFLNPNQLSLLFQRSGVTKWLLSDITARRTQNLWRYLRNELDIDEVDPEMFARRIDKLFLEQQSDNWFIDFYKFLSVGDRPPKSLWSAASNDLQRPGILRSKPILRLQDDSLVNPNEPDLYLSKGTTSDTTSRLIKSEISQNEEAHKFLEELGIPEWDIVAEVIKEILPKYWNDPSSITTVDYERDFSKIVSAYDIDSEKKKNQLREKLKTTSFIFANDLDTSSPMYLKPNQLYFGTDGLWTGSAGIYSRAFISEEILQFLQKLDIPQWDIVEEVIKTILPKYKQDSLTVSIKAHMNDLEKITQAYKIGVLSRKIQLQTELKATRFIQAEGTHEHNPEYHRPNELYFGTEELRLYFEGDDSCKFVSSKYTDRHVEVFKELEISRRIQITCKSKPGMTDDVDLAYQSGCYRRGLKGFDPYIQVAGLKHALMSPSIKKSKVIWENVAVPYSHCIRGKILRSSRRDFSPNARTYKENEVTSDFGRMLMENAWIPDSDGNWHKPSEITLAELPEEFVRNEQLANQLRMKKDEVAELAEKSGVSVEVIRDLIENPEEYKKYKAWKAERTEEDQPVPPEQENTELETKIDYQSELEKSFNKTGQTIVQPHITDDGKVVNPERRREKIAEEHRDRLNREPSADDRRRETYRTLLEGPDPQVRGYLSQMYGGKCQICDQTFPERDGKPFFVANYIVERQKSGAVDTAANALCLCADHFAKFKHGAIEADDVRTQIENFQTESEGGDCEPILDIKLCGEECEIRFKEKHLLDLQELLKTSSDN